MPKKCYFEPYSRWVLSDFCALIVSIKPIECSGLLSITYAISRLFVVILQVFCVPRPLKSNSMSRCVEP